ncbi:hypothetical protein PoB_005192400 [Plakobranchus ocellatus]|uniref:Uncharacterized protein n=1 Tax=Plakobranchus ocellatus TaxID=259542 RepID=A0AAV4C2T8_9GAST|nr:hypothetical protein PoB_005192400 [Plakobranchus ocellatus]
MGSEGDWVIQHEFEPEVRRAICGSYGPSDAAAAAVEFRAPDALQYGGRMLPKHIVFNVNILTQISNRLLESANTCGADVKTKWPGRFSPEICHKPCTNQKKIIHTFFMTVRLRVVRRLQMLLILLLCLSI